MDAKTRTNGSSGAPRANRNAELHGLNTMKRALKELGSRAIDKRTTVGRELHAWRDELISDLGGIDGVSTQQLALVDVCVKQKLLLDSIDVYLLEMPSLVNRRRRCLYPVVQQRQSLADGLSKYLGQLGLERREKVVDLAVAIQDAQREREQEAP